MQSSNAVLTVLRLPVVSQNPESVKTNEGATATFSVGGTSDVPLTLRYQWRHNGQPIANATNSILTLNNVISDVDDGDYSAVITDRLGTVTSAAGTLTVLLAPTISQPKAKPYPDWRRDKQKWFLPAVLVLFVAVLGLEWGLRRAWGMV